MSRWFGWLIAILVILLDQFTKWLVVLYMPLGSTKYLTSFFKLWYLQNTGAAFSFLANAGGWQIWFFNIFAGVMALVVALSLLWRARWPAWQVCALGLILGGAVGNLLDRLRLGYVVDFIAWHIGDWYWPVFNIADSAITIGVLLYVIGTLLSGDESAVSKGKVK